MRPKKRLFLGLLFFVLMLLLFLAYFVWGLVFAQLGRAYQDVFLLMDLGLGIAIPVLALGIFGIVVMVLLQRPWPFLSRFSKNTMDFLFPMALILGKVFRLDKERIESSFIELNNQLVRLTGGHVSASRILILLPHCLQRSLCKRRITYQAANCRRCGMCNVGEILSLADEFGAEVAVATGGTAARQAVRDKRPVAVVAVACERDLSSGIHEAGKLPVLGVPNQRPNGPCRDTVVSPGAIRQALESLVNGGTI